jgi:hypothetical protein
VDTTPTTSHDHVLVADRDHVDVDVKVNDYEDDYERVKTGDR